MGAGAGAVGAGAGAERERSGSEAFTHYDSRNPVESGEGRVFSSFDHVTPILSSFDHVRLGRPPP